MQESTTRYTIDKQAGRHRLFVCLLLLPLVLFTLSGFTFSPNTAHTPNRVTEPPLPLALHPGYAADDGCSDAISLVEFSWSEIKLYINDCALQHLSAWITSVGAGAAFVGFVSLWCEGCAPIAAVLTFIAGGFMSNIDFLQYASQGCGGAFLDISWFGGIQFEPACSPQDNGS